VPGLPAKHGHKQHRYGGLRGVRGGQDDGRAHRACGVRLRRGHGAWRRWGMRDVPGRLLQGHEHRQVREPRVRELQQLRNGAAGGHRVQQHAQRDVQGVPGQQLVVRGPDVAGALPVQRRLRAPGGAVRRLPHRQGPPGQWYRQVRYSVKTYNLS
jgi:hypothetical protein